MAAPAARAGTSPLGTPPPPPRQRANIWRRIIPYSLLPLAVMATGLTSGLWLRAFPSSVMLGPLVGASVISVLLPVAVAGLFSQRLWVTALVDLVALVLFELFVVLRSPTALGELWRGVAHGPAQLLTFALPLVSPRSLLVAPIVLCWVCGAIAGECIGRSWQSVVPYAAWLVTFGLTYAGTVRAITTTSSGRRIDTLVAAGVLLTLLLFRAASTWVGQNGDAETTQADGVLPLRGFAVGAILALVLAAAAAGVVQTSPFSGPPTSPQRVPSVDRGQTLTPLSYVASLRQRSRSAGKAETLFQVRLNKASTGYFTLATVDTYDGDAWTFDRTFRPSGGVIPTETDPTLRGKSSETQTYTIAANGLTGTPWMPYVQRPERVSGTAVDVDESSGMIVPDSSLRAQMTYRVESRTTTTAFADLASSAVAATSASPSDRGIPGQLQQEMGNIVKSFEDETGVSRSNPIAFLKAVQQDLRTRYSLSGGVSGRAGADDRTGGTSFADVLASILGVGENGRKGTPEQYATLVTLIARALNVPARIAAGFRVLPRRGQATVAAGSHRVTDAEAWSWVEIPVAGRGWVVLDPAPSTFSNVAPPSNSGTAASSSAPPSSAPQTLVTSSAGGNAPAPPSKVTHRHSTSTATVLLLVLVGLAALAVLIVLVLLVRKRVRARLRRRVADPRRRLLGAWHESIDVLIEAGLPELESLTSAEVAALAEARFGETTGAKTARLGDAANTAIFSPTSWVTSADADSAWSQHWSLRRDVRRRLGWSGRLAAGARYHHIPRRRPIDGPTSWTEAMRARRIPRRPGRHRFRRPRRTH